MFEELELVANPRAPQHRDIRRYPFLAEALLPEPKVRSAITGEIASHSSIHLLELGLSVERRMSLADPLVLI